MSNAVPKRGQIVLLLGISSNGSDEQAAVVTNVFFVDPEKPGYVNLKALLDNGPVLDRSSVQWQSTREAAVEWRNAQTHAPAFVAFPVD